MKSITIAVAIVVLLNCSGFGANLGEALRSEKRIQKLIKQLDGRTWDQETNLVLVETKRCHNVTM